MNCAINFDQCLDMFLKFAFILFWDIVFGEKKKSKVSYGCSYFDM